MTISLGWKRISESATTKSACRIHEINLSGAKNIDKKIVFDGNTYNVNAYVESELKTSMIDFEYQYKLLNFKNILAGLSIGIIGKVKYFDGEVRMHSIRSVTIIKKISTFLFL